jgi:hypothetical protein
VKGHVSNLRGGHLTITPDGGRLRRDATIHVDFDIASKGGISFVRHPRVKVDVYTEPTSPYLAVAIEEDTSPTHSRRPSKKFLEASAPATQKADTPPDAPPTQPGRVIEITPEKAILVLPDYPDEHVTLAYGTARTARYRWKGIHIDTILPVEALGRNKGGRYVTKLAPAPREEALSPTATTAPEIG